MPDSLEQMFGGGLSSRITDGYAAIASVWQPRDRIYLFGFSRGAYTVRCLAHVLELFGVPGKEPGSDSISLEPKRLHRICREAVGILYRAGLTVPDTDSRKKAVASFREKYGSRVGGPVGAVPYFIGVWDTVAAVGWARFLAEPLRHAFPARGALRAPRYGNR